MQSQSQQKTNYHEASQVTDDNLSQGSSHGSSQEALVIQNMFFIQTKSGKQVEFKLNHAQSEYDKNKTNRDIIPKARQEGFSSLGIAYQTVDCLGREGTRAVLISHEAKATQRLLGKADYYIRHLRGASAKLGRHSRNEFYFPKTESSYYIGTAGAKAFGRGDTINHLHISEYAWWESDALKQVAGLFQAVPMDGTIRIESTGNGRTNDFYYICENADQLGYRVHFAPWWQHHEYQLEPAGGWYPEGFENYFQDMKQKYRLSDHQMYWYWLKLLEFRQDLPYMKQEYPSSLEECFQSTGGAVFPDVTRVKSEYWKYRLDRHEFLDNALRVEYLQHHPSKEFTYTIGADPSGGTGHDNCATQIFCLETYEQVLEIASNTIDPVVYGHLLCYYGKLYNNAFMVCEANHHGIATHSILKKHYNRIKLYKRILPTKHGQVKYGFTTTENTKAELVGSIRECIDLGLTIYGKSTIDEMRKFEESETGKMEGPKDDLVIALGLACIGLLKYKRYCNSLATTRPVTQKPKIEWDGNFMITLDDILSSIEEKNQAQSVFQDQLRR